MVRLHTRPDGSRRLDSPGRPAPFQPFNSDTMNKYFKKKSKDADIFVMVGNSRTGVRVLTCGEYTQIDNISAAFVGDCEPVEEQEFVQAYDLALSKITRLIPVAA